MKREVLTQVLADLRARRPAVLASWLETGRAVLVHPFDTAEADGSSLREAARDAAQADETRELELEGAKVLLRPFNPPVRVVIVGAVHIAQALAPMAKLGGFDVVVVDPRRAWASPERFPGVPLIAAWPEEAFAEAAPDRRTAVVTLTHDPKIDDPALAAALRSEAFYVGALGSRRTHAARRERLAAMGFDDASLARIHGPVGLGIGARSPGEIAVSILAQVVARLRGAGVAA